MVLLKFCIFILFYLDCFLVGFVEERGRKVVIVERSCGNGVIVVKRLNFGDGICFWRNKFMKCWWVGVCFFYFKKYGEVLEII